MSDDFFDNGDDQIEDLLKIVNEYRKILYSYKEDSQEIVLKKLRQMVVEHGIPSDDQLRKVAQEEPNNAEIITTLRQKLWMFFIGVPDDKTEAEKEYRAQLHKGVHRYWDHICSDSIRTFVDPSWSQERKDARAHTVQRVMNALYLHLEEGFGDDLEFVQGLNTFVGILLESGLCEAQAYICFKQLMTEFLPEYVANRGMKQAFVLTEMCLWELNPPFYLWLSNITKSQGMDVGRVLQPVVLSLGGVLPPLDEVVLLWDFILAFGVTIFPLCFAAFLMLMEPCFKEEPKLQLARPEKGKFYWSARAVAHKTISLLKIMITEGKEKDEMRELYNCMIYHGRGETEDGVSVSGRAMQMWIERGGFAFDKHIRHYKLVYEKTN